MFAPWPKTLRQRAPQAFEIARLLSSPLLWYKTIVFGQSRYRKFSQIPPDLVVKF